MSNLHVSLNEANKHTPKGFDNAPSNNTIPWKDENDLSNYTENFKLPRAINFVDGTAVAPTTVDGAIYVIISSGVLDASWGTLAAFGDWVRFANGSAVAITPAIGTLCFDDTAAAWKEYDGSNWAAHVSATTNLTEGANTLTTVDVDSSTGTNATLLEASTSRAGLLGKAKWDEIVDNTAKITFPEAPNDGTQYARKNLGWEAVAATSGIVGISNASGVYTYYATLTLAMTAAVSGDTVTLFANIEETGAVEIVLKNGVNINGNGHTYTLNNNGNLYTVKDNNVACEVKISDFHFKRIGTVLTADENLNYILGVQSTLSKIDVTGCSFVSSNLPACSNSGTLIGGYFKGNGTRFALAYSLQNSGFVYNGVFESEAALLVSQQATIYNSGALHNCIITSVDVRSITNIGEAYNCTGEATAVGVVSLYNDTGGELFNCSAKADGIAIDIINGGKASECNGYSTGNFGIRVGTNGELSNSTGYSLANNGIEASTTTSKLYNCVGKSDAASGINIFGYAWNCTGYSTAGVGITSYVNCNVYNSTGISTVSVGGANGLNWFNCIFESFLNTTAGHAYSNGFVIGVNLTGCTFKVANAGAFCITNGNRATNYSNSNFIGATVPVNPTTPQGIVNTHDNQGNILI